MTPLFDWLIDPALPAPAPGLLPEYVFRYMGSDGLLHTVRDRQLRLNAWSLMNDPRESKQWTSSGALAATGTYTVPEMNKRLDDVLRRSARLIALTADRSVTSVADPASLFHRGWGRAAMWAHYAQGHHGVCLVLDMAAINETIRDLPAVDGRYTTWGWITYADEPIRVDLTGAFADQASLDQAIEDLLDKRWTLSGLHMSKNLDWAYETELRIASVDLHLDNHEMGTPLSISLGDCLKAVIFGDEHPAPSVIAGGVQADMGPDAPEFFQCHWIDGAPGLSPLVV